MTNAQTCATCARPYAYDLRYCTFCRGPLSKVVENAGRVLAATRVDVPSVGHEDTPYWCALVRSEGGTQWILKLDKEPTIGEVLQLQGVESDQLPKLGVVGTGVMGRGLVELMLSRGHEVVWLSRFEASLEFVCGHVFERLAKTMSEQEIESARARLFLSVEASDLEPCDIVIEAVIEDLEAKIEALVRAEAGMRADSLLASNTSGLSLDSLAACLEHPERFGALHFFNPPNRMRLVETSASRMSAPATMAALDEFVLSLGKTPVRVAQRPAFVVNRVLMPLINEAIRSLQEGAASAQSIDEAVRLGLNHPMGPLALADLIGLDVVLLIMENLVEQTGDLSYEPRKTLRDLVDAGHLGRKTGRGFHEYAQ